MKLRGVGEIARPPGGIRADHRQTYQLIEGHAAKVRCVLAPELQVYEALPTLGLFESLGKVPLPTPFGNVEIEGAVKNLPSGVEGWTEYDKEHNRIIITLDEATTYAGLEIDQRRARYCFCHEVGHAVLHPRELMRTGAIAHQMAALRRGGTLPHRKYMDTEWQANAFAAALLMPAVGMAVLEAQFGMLSAMLISLRFKVSAEAATYRLESFNTRRGQLLAAN